MLWRTDFPISKSFKTIKSEIFNLRRLLSASSRLKFSYSSTLEKDEEN